MRTLRCSAGAAAAATYQRSTILGPAQLNWVREWTLSLASSLSQLQQALTLSQIGGNPVNEARTLDDLGEALRATGQFHEARNQHTTALTLATQVGDRYEQARAHNGIAHTYNATGDAGEARHYWHEALALYTELSVPEAEDVRAHLTKLDQAADVDAGW
ncbi:MAG: tetratricopeptide repeat protein [Gammaproteobacteria bacterium]